MGAWSIECPQCCFVGDEDDFDMSQSDECFCPECGCGFILGTDDGGDEDD